MRSVLRRSVKAAEKLEAKPHHISLTTKSAIAILPPKKVIKALYDYDPDPGDTTKLAFAKGDFFHVISREDDDDWYEACNPLIPTARGLVPVSYFEVIGKTERRSAGSVGSGPSSTAPPPPPLDPVQNTENAVRQEPNGAAKTSGHNRMSSMGRGTGAMVYGMVQYDFAAERPDELEAKAGEPIIVIAQSNPEWFVAKPIGRLGGPGLIPVSFIEIRDMATGRAVPDAQAAVTAAGVPKVEEWKKMAAEYKNSSISLGKFETSSAQRDLERMSFKNGSQQYTNINGGTHGQSLHQRNGSRSQNSYNRDSQRTLLAPISASVPRYCFENEKYWYIIECVMEDGRHWELSRFYQNFYDFQISLLQQFPKEADSNGGTRVLPYMPGPVTYVTDAISNGRRESLNDYVKKLLSLPTYISRCQLVRELFAPREGDFELDPRAVGEDYRLSQASMQSSTDGLSRTVSHQSSHGQINNNGYSANPGHQRSQNSVSTTNGVGAASQTVYRTQPDFQNQGTINPQPSPFTHTSSTSLLGTRQSPPANNSTTNVAMSGAVKIKVFYEDDCIAIRVPTDISFEQLKDKLKDRLKIKDEILVQYKDEPTANYAELISDRDLDVALERNPKLQLYVQSTGL